MAHHPAAPHQAHVHRVGARHGFWLGIHADWRAALFAGLGAGALFLVLELLTAFAFESGTPFGPAHVVLQGFTAPDTPSSEPSALLVVSSIFLHFALSLLVVLPLAILIHPWKDVAISTAVGAALGVLLFMVNQLVLAYLLPVWTEARFGFMLFDYAVFGMAAAFCYKTCQRRDDDL